MDLVTQLQQLANEQTSFAQGLRQKREALSQALNKFYETTQPKDMWSTPQGIPLQPSRVMSSETALRGAFQKALSPYSPELEMSAKNSAANILMDLLKLEQNNNNDDTLSSLLKERNALKEAGFDTSSIDKELEGAGFSKLQSSDKEILDPTVKAYVDQFKNGSLTKITDVPSDDRGKVVKALSKLGLSIKDIQRQSVGKQVASSLRVLYDLYTGGDGLGGNKDLDYGRLGGGIADLMSLLGKNANVKTYNQTRKGLAATIKKLAGETGVLTDYDTKRLLGLLPKVTDNPEEAKKQWDAVNEFLNKKFGVSIFGEKQQTSNDPLNLGI